MLVFKLIKMNIIRTNKKIFLSIKKRVRGYLNESLNCSSLTVPLPIPVVFEMVPI